MKFGTLGIVSVFGLLLAASGMGCEPYHRDRVGVDVDIHASDRGNRQDDEKKNDHPDNNGPHDQDHPQDNH